MNYGLNKIDGQSIEIDEQSLYINGQSILINPSGRKFLGNFILALFLVVPSFMLVFALPE